MSPSPLIAIRADGGPEIGMGHMTRCAALAAALEDEGAETLWLTRTPDRVPASYSGAMEALSPDEEGLPRADAFVGDWKDSDNQRAARIRRRMPLVLLGRGSEPADLAIRQHFDPKADAVSGELAGPDYVILPKAFAALPVRPQPLGPARRLLVSLGGGRTPVFDQVCAALARLEGREAMTLRLIGEGDPGAVQTAGFQSLRHEKRSADMARAMADADLGVLAGGTSLHEAAASGLPVICVPLAANQARRTAALETLGLGRRANAGDPDALARAVAELAADSESRGAMSARGQALIDGQGAPRCARAILALVRAR